MVGYCWKKHRHPAQRNRDGKAGVQRSRITRDPATRRSQTTAWNPSGEGCWRCTPRHDPSSGSEHRPPTRSAQRSRREARSTPARAGYRSSEINPTYGVAEAPPGVPSPCGVNMAGAPGCFVGDPWDYFIRAERMAFLTVAVGASSVPPSASREALLELFPVAVPVVSAPDTASAAARSPGPAFGRPRRGSQETAHSWVPRSGSAALSPLDRSACY